MPLNRVSSAVIAVSTLTTALSAVTFVPLSPVPAGLTQLAAMVVPALAPLRSVLLEDLIALMMLGLAGVVLLASALDRLLNRHDTN